MDFSTRNKSCHFIFAVKSRFLKFQELLTHLRQICDCNQICDCSVWHGCRRKDDHYCRWKYHPEKMVFSSAHSDKKVFNDGDGIRLVSTLQRSKLVSQLTSVDVVPCGSCICVSDSFGSVLYVIYVYCVRYLSTKLFGPLKHRASQLL